MSYTKTNWIDNVTPASAVNMNRIEESIEALDEVITNWNVEAGLDSINMINEQLAEQSTQITTNTDKIETAFLNVLYPPIPMNGAKGDGVTDDTTAIQNIINHAQSIGADVLFPQSKYKINSIDVLEGVNIIGEYTSNPLRTNGTWLYCVDTNNPAIKVYGSSKVEAFAFYYPEQSWDSINNKPLHEYPASIQIEINARRTAIRDIFLLNSYVGIDASLNHETLTLENIQGYCISQGVICGRNSDIDRYKTVHFNYNAIAIVNMPNYLDFAKWTRTNGTAFTIARADFILLFDCFAYGYRKGCVFAGDDTGYLGSGHLTKSGFDGCGECVEQNGGWGLSIDDCFFTSFDPFDAGLPVDYYAINITSANDFTLHNCRFWACDKYCLALAADDSIISENKFYGYGMSGNNFGGIYIIRGDVNIQANTFKGNSNNTEGIEVHSSASDTIKINNNIFKNLLSTGIFTDTNVNHLDISHNTFKSVSTAIYNAAAPTNYVNVNNIIA